MTVKMVGMLIGVVLIVVGALGFITPWVLSGISVIDTGHNLLRLATGLIFLLGASGWGKPRATMQIVGVLWAVAAVLQFLTSGDSLFGLMAMNAADWWVNLILAVAMFAVSWWAPEEWTSPWIRA
ncbi:MAG: DUF4383 domain-containing protein [Hyphomicrobiaceae bacterium]